MFASLFLKRAKKETLSILFERSQSSPQTGYGFYVYVLFFSWPCCTACGILVPKEGWNPRPPALAKS